MPALCVIPGGVPRRNRRAVLKKMFLLSGHSSRLDLIPESLRQDINNTTIIVNDLTFHLIVSYTVAMEFKAELRKWRLNWNWMQKEAADHLKVSLRTYQSWEEGVRTPDTIKLVEIRRRMYGN